ncbi:MAG: hypothetical protein JO267_01820 [Alphaproteobacteria bacterium]|nr:hypothetical protein [Alphaproteobacteria bacterium]MBV9860865.1 hypothetical protein [Alphaproteobacteria bacterium]
MTAERGGEGRLSGGANLRGFFLALEGLERHQLTRPVRILQIGDSHTANDAFSSAMRARLQTRFGAAGRGWLPGGVPFKYFRPQLVSVSESGWRHLGQADAGQVPMGIDVTLAQSEGPAARMTLTSTEPEGFNRFELELLLQPGGGPLAVRIDQRKPIPVTTDAPAVRLKRVEISLPAAAHEIELTALGQQPADVLGWTIERRHPGIIYENHGTIGATINLIGKMNTSAVGFELAARRPALLVIAFGTNEGFDESLDLGQYAANFQTAVEALHDKAPDASVLIIGPPDGNRMDRSCTPGDGQPALPAAGCTASLSSETSCAWHPPRNLAAVRQIQKRIAAARGWAFWDWSQAMGGTCSIDRLAGLDPPLAAADHVHLTKTGYAAAADILFQDLMAEYERTKRDARPPRR